MPTAPLYYTPLLMGAMRSAPVGPPEMGGTVASAASMGIRLTMQPANTGQTLLLPEPDNLPGAAMMKENGKRVEPTLLGLSAEIQARSAVANIHSVSFALEPMSYAGARTMTHFAGSPAEFEYASPDAIRGRSAEIANAFSNGPQPLAAWSPTGQLDIGPDITKVMVDAWEGKPVAPTDAARAAMWVSKELERATSPNRIKELEWLDNGTVDLLGSNPQAVAKMTKSLGLAGDDPKMLEAAQAVHKEVMDASPEARTAVRLLKLAGVDTAAETVGVEATKILQLSPPENPLALLSEGIVKAQNLPTDKTSWVQQRILETGGVDANLDGFEAQIREMTAPKPVTPEPGPGNLPQPDGATPAPAPAPAPAPEPVPAPAPAPAPAA